MEQTEKKFSKRRVIDFFIDLIIHVIANEKGLKYLEEHYLNEEKRKIEIIYLNQIAFEHT